MSRISQQVNFLKLNIKYRLLKNNFPVVFKHEISSEPVEVVVLVRNILTIRNTLCEWVTVLKSSVYL